MPYSGQDEDFMAWKQDLAKLKQTLGPEAPLPPARPKAPPRPEPTRSLEAEDEIFLSAMGHRAKAPRPEPEPVAPAAAVAEPALQPEAPAPKAAQDPAPAPPAVAPETFQEALKDLKGLKPMARGPLAKPARAAAPKAAPAPAPRPVHAPPPVPAPVPVTAEVTPAEPAPAPTPVAAAAPAPSPTPVAAVARTSAPRAEPASEPPAPGPLPVRFQLAAGMAIEVDGLLDLRGHSLVDAQERLKDRLEDGRLLGWHSLQVTLGPDPGLHDGLLALLNSGGLPQVGRYAQAPVPMGGSQAWLLYYAPSQPRPCEESRP